MPNSFTHYWVENENSQSADSLLNHAASNKFRKAGIAPGDWIFIFNQQSDQLKLVARMRVKDIVDRDEARRQLGIEDLFEGDDHILGDNGSNITFNRIIPPEIVRRLRFQTATGKTAVTFNNNGGAVEQSMRSIRHLTVESAEELNRFIDETDQTR